MSGIEFDPDKDAKNIAKHGISLRAAEDFVPSKIVQDTRKNYGEDRFQAFGHIGKVAHLLVFTPRDGKVRAISLRAASNKEVAANGPTIKEPKAKK